MHGLRRRLSEPRMAGHLPADRSANQRVTSAGDSFLCILMCGTQHTYVQSKKQAKIAPVENSKRAGSTGLSWDLRQKLDYSPQHWQASSSRLPSSRVMLPAYAGPCLGSRPVAWLDGMVEILVLVEFPTGMGRERVRV